MAPTIKSTAAYPSPAPSPSMKGGNGVDIFSHTFRAPHDDAIGDDQPHKDAQYLGNAKKIGLQKLVDDDHKNGDDGELGDHADAVGRDFAQQRDKQ